MERIERLKLAIERGYTCNPKTGEIFGATGKKLTRKNPNGYIIFGVKVDKKSYRIRGHHFIWYYVNKENADVLDHINRIRDDNRIENLRSVSNQQNLFNKDVKGYGWHKHSKKWRSMIGLDGKSIHIGYFDTEQEAHDAYIKAKLLHHII